MAGLTIDVNIKDTELFGSLCKVTAFLLDKADSETSAEATRQLIDAGIIKDPSRLKN